MQLDHLGDAVLSTPLIAELRAAYPEATIDVLASPSNHEVFEAVDPHVNRVLVAERTWFERRPERWGLVTAVWKLGRSLQGTPIRPGHRRARRRASVLVLALARSSAAGRLVDGGGAFLLTDVAAWIPGRHEVRSRLALLATAWNHVPTSGSRGRDRPRPGSDHDRPPARGSLASPRCTANRGLRRSRATRPAR